MRGIAAGILSTSQQTPRYRLRCKAFWIVWTILIFFPKVNKVIRIPRVPGKPVHEAAFQEYLYYKRNNEDGIIGPEVNTGSSFICGANFPYSILRYTDSIFLFKYFSFTVLQYAVWCWVHSHTPTPCKPPDAIGAFIRIYRLPHTHGHYYFQLQSVFFSIHTGRNTRPSSSTEMELSSWIGDGNVLHNRRSASSIESCPLLRTPDGEPFTPISPIYRWSFAYCFQPSKTWILSAPAEPVWTGAFLLFLCS